MRLRKNQSGFLLSCTPNWLPHLIFVTHSRKIDVVISSGPLFGSEDLFKSYNTCASSASESEVLSRVTAGFFTLVHKGKVEFSGVMIDNGAARSPSGVNCYMRYCTYTGYKPEIRPSNRAMRELCLRSRIFCSQMNI